jgi:transcriptional regulator with XRE-family HTH domain
MLLTSNGLQCDYFGMGWSQKLKAAAGAKKLSGAAIGRALGYSATSANEWLRGETEPEFAILQPLCDLLGIQVAWLFDDSVTDDLTGPGLLACKLFAETIKEKGPYSAIALLGGSTQPGRVGTGYTSANHPIGYDKPSDLEEPPSTVVGAVAGPRTGGSPNQGQFDNPPTSQRDVTGVPKKKRKL